MPNATLRRPDVLRFGLTQATGEGLRITRRTLYVMLERRTNPAVVRAGRPRVVFATEVLLQWLRQQRASSAARKGAA